MADNELDLYNELCEYRSLDNSKFGEYVDSIIYCMDMCKESYGADRDFRNALFMEASRLLFKYKEETEVEEVVEPQPPVRYKQLKWIEE